jgi:cytidylate kinase
MNPARDSLGHSASAPVGGSAARSPAGPVRRGPLVVAIDGPAGSGKSTVAKLLATALRWAHLDTGAMYRAVTWRAMQLGIPLDQGTALADLASRAQVQLDPGRGRVAIDGADVTEPIRTQAVDAGVSVVAALGAVRTVMRRHQREFATAFGRIVAEGRDMGTRVFPEAVVKVFLVATVDERVRRRVAELQAAARQGPGGGQVDPAAVRRALIERDRLDESRDVDPLRPAPDAVELDTTGLTPAQVVDTILALVRSRVLPSETA